MDTPICVANCVNEIARKISNAAQSTDVPIVGNPPLAQALCAIVYMDDPVPEDHYKVVPEVIGFVMDLKPSLFKMYETHSKCTKPVTERAYANKSL